jgi:hypothetical protein
MKKELKILLKTLIASISIVIILILVLGLIFIKISRLGMRPKPRPIELPYELGSLQDSVAEKYGLFPPIFNSPISDSTCNVEYINVETIKDCSKGKKLIFPVRISIIENPKYFDERLMTKETDSINNLVQKYLPHKECIDSVYIEICARDTAKLNNGKRGLVYDKILKYPVIK